MVCNFVKNLFVLEICGCKVCPQFCDILGTRISRRHCNNIIFIRRGKLYDQPPLQHSGVCQKCQDFQTAKLVSLVGSYSHVEKSLFSSIPNIQYGSLNSVEFKMWVGWGAPKVLGLLVRCNLSHWICVWWIQLCGCFLYLSSDNRNRFIF